MNFIFDNERPIYMQLVEQMRIAIVSGVLSAGKRIPSVRELAFEAKVNPNTMQKALSELESEGLIYTERTNGKFVTEDTELINRVKREVAKDKVQGYLRDMQKIGISFNDAVIYLQELGGENE